MNVVAGTDVERVLTVNASDAPPTVSVVVASHEHGRYLGDTLQGVAAQDDVSLELIVVDDASTDDTEEVVRSFAASTSIPLTYLRRRSRGGQAVARNHGIDLARGEYCAFTDADCVPSPQWLGRALRAFDDGSVGMVQGRTECLQDRPKMLTHFIETLRFDGSFSTSNIVYRSVAIGSHRFDASCAYWEDTDLGFRVRGEGWNCGFAADALVYHQAVPQSVAKWLLWPTRYSNWPAKAAQYPEFRRTLFLKLWVRPLHACFDLAVAGLVAMALGRRRLAGLLFLPYMVAFAHARGLKGRAPAIKVVLHATRDAVALAALVSGSIRHRRVVL